MWTVSKNPIHAAKQMQEYARAKEWRMPPIEPMLWRAKAETTILIGKCATSRSIADIRLPRVKWVEAGL